MLYEEYLSQLRKSIPVLLNMFEIPGMSISIVDRDGVIFSEGFGITSLGKTYKVTENTQFGVQSISKTYTAFGFMLAVDNEKVHIDDPIHKYVPGFNVKNRYDVDYSKKITFRHLLKHRSGLACEFPVGNYLDCYSSVGDRIKSINETYIKFAPDDDYSYSNMGYDLIAYALSNIFDMSYDDYVCKYIFEPLEMSNSTFDYKKILLNFKSAVGHNNNVPLVKYPENPLGSGGMYSCVKDMTNFITCFLNGGVFNNKRIINKGILQQMYSEYPINEQWKYHIGFDVALINDKLCLNHNGRGYGFQTIQDLYPNNGLGCVIVTNSSNHPFVHHQICRNISSDLLTLKDTESNDCSEFEEYSYNEYIGLYRLDDYILADDDNVSVAIYPRNGYLYFNNRKLKKHNKHIFFTDNNDIVEFLDNAARINYWYYNKVNR